jgi:hypothetical protein
MPDGFVKLRHYGLLAPGNVNTRLAAARTVLEATSPAAPIAPVDVSTAALATWVELLRQLTGLDVRHSAKCGGDVHSRALDRPATRDTS